MQGEPSISGRFCWPIRVYFEDTDAGGVVYYANYLRYMERARTEWLREKGFDHTTLGKTAGVIFVVRAAAVDYLRPARLDDLLRVTVSVKTKTRSTVTFAQRVIRPGEGEANGDELLARGEVKVVCVDAATFAPRAVPQMLNEVIR